MSNNKSSVLIIGASKGVGRAVVEELISRDVLSKLFLVSRSDVELQELKLKAESENIVCDYRIVDLNFPTKVGEQLMTWLQDEVIDVFYYNAGYLSHQNLAGISFSEVEKMFNVNVFSFIESWKAIHQNVIRSKKSQVVVSGSMGGYQGSVKFPGLSSYSSSKAALANLIEVLAEEHKEDEVIFNTLSFGAVNTEMLQEAFPDYSCDVQPSDMAQFVCDFILGPRLFNGKNIPISITTP